MPTATSPAATAIPSATRATTCLGDQRGHELEHAELRRGASAASRWPSAGAAPRPRSRWRGCSRRSPGTRHRVPAPHRGNTGVVALYTRRSAGSPLSDTYYVHRDHLAARSCSPGERDGAGGLSFSAYGSGAIPTGRPIGSTDLATLGNTTREGYTGTRCSMGWSGSHERAGLRPGHWQIPVARPAGRRAGLAGANGYAYVWNNPLTLNDPSGYEVSADDIKKQWEDAGGGRNEEVVVTASRLRLYLGSLAREYNGRLSDLTAALGRRRRISRMRAQEAARPGWKWR